MSWRGNGINFFLFFIFLIPKKINKKEKEKEFFFSRFSLDKKGCFKHWKIRFEQST